MTLIWFATLYLYYNTCDGVCSLGGCIGKLSKMMIDMEMADMANKTNMDNFTELLLISHYRASCKVLKFGTSLELKWRSYEVCKMLLQKTVQDQLTISILIVRGLLEQQHILAIYRHTESLGQKATVSQHLLVELYR